MPSERYAIRSRQVLTADGLEDCAVVIQGGKIQALLSPSDLPEDLSVEDAGSLVVMPGLVDCHVHLNEPGRTEWEGFETGTQAAAAGGITSVVEMPLNCIPVTTTVAALQEKRQVSEGKLWTDCAFYGGVIPGNTEQIEPLIEAGVVGFKAFLIHSGIDDFPNVTEADLRQVMPILAKHEIPLLVHAELDCCPGSLAVTESPQQYHTYLHSRPPRWELDAIGLVIRLAELYQCRVHIVHLSCAEALPMIQAAKSRGVPITVETCPHYLTFYAEEIMEGDTRFKCAPPIREKANREALWQGLKEGIIDFVVSDHSPCTPELKHLDTGDFMTAWGGISSLQYGLPVVWGQARERGFSLQDVSRWMASAPAQFAGLGATKGQLAPGYDADLVIWDPDAAVTINSSENRHRNKLTPYEGRGVAGRIHQTILRGKTLIREGQVVSSAIGQPRLLTEFLTEKGLVPWS